MLRINSLGVAFLAAATLLLESALLRLLAVSQYYHFAFLVISLALLGFGASGSFLTLSRRLNRLPGLRKILNNNPDLLIISGLMFALSILIAYGIVNFLPFDSYRIAWEIRQIGLFLLYYLALALPFFFSGIGIGGSLALNKGQSHIIYSANLIGSGVGVVLALIAMWFAGVPGAVVLCGIISLLVALIGFWGKEFHRSEQTNYPKSDQKILILVVIAIALILVLGLGYLSILNLSNKSSLGLVISPYKGLSNAIRYPGSEVLFGRWNAVSRIDILADAGTKQLPGLSYRYPDPPPVQYGLSVDAEPLQPITLIAPEEFEAAQYLPEAIAYSLKPEAEVLVIEPAGGLGVLQALAGDASSVTVILNNPLVGTSVEETAAEYDVYHHEDVNTIFESPRVYIRQTEEQYDIVFIPLTDSYRPVTSGAYSLSEVYRLTVEAFEEYIARLRAGGIVIATRWLQTPPSENLKMMATIIEALNKQGVPDPKEAVVAYRGIQTMTILVKPDGWQESDLKLLRYFIGARSYDLVWAPDMKPEEANLTNLLPEPIYYNSVSELLNATDLEAFISAYPSAINPPKDDSPFFYHFFKWGQTPEVLATIGRTWQPFGGSGYFVLIALLLLVLLLSVLLILIPFLGIRPKSEINSPFWRILIYFGSLGLAFLFVEIPLIQQSILILGHPSYAFTVVVLALLSFSSIGSFYARKSWLPKRTALGLLVILSILSPWIITRIAYMILEWPFIMRVLVVGISITPLAVLMGIPFPSGLAWLEQRWEHLVSWAWAVNGCASVIAAVLAAILTLSHGYRLVLIMGAAAYAVAYLVFPRERDKPDWSKIHRFRFSRDLFK